MTEKAFQDYYRAVDSICYGCGRLNRHGLQIKSYWDGDESVCHFIPQPYHTASKDYVYGGIIASVIDCHGTGTATAAAYKATGHDMGTKPDIRFVTASLHVEYLRPTPIEVPMELRGRVKEIRGRRVIVSITLSSKGQICAVGEVVAMQIPEHLQ